MGPPAGTGCKPSTSLLNNCQVFCRKKLQNKRLPEPTLQDRVQMHLLLAEALTATNNLPEATKVG